MGIPRAITRISRRTVLAVGLLLLGLAAACGGGSGSDTESLVPQRATVVASVAAGEALDAIDLELDQLLEMLSSRSDSGDDGFGELFDLDQFRSGGLFGGVSRIDIFAEITDGDDVEYFGVVLQGSFDEPELIAELESKFDKSLTQSVYKGSNVYAPQDGDDDFALSVLDSSIFVIGSGGAVNDIIDIKAGDADPASGVLMDTFKEFDGGLFAFALMVPQGITEETDLGSIPGFGDLPISLDFISALDIVGLGGTLNGGSLDLVVTMDFTDEESAESLENFISGIVTLASGFLTDPNTTGLLEGLKVDRDGSLLTIKIGIPVTDIPDLFENLNPLTGAGSSSSSNDLGQRESPEVRRLVNVIGEPVPILSSVNHVSEGQRVDYQDAPPSSGEHWSTPARCGFYTDSLPDERIVHNMEHGNVVVSYNFTNPALTTELRQALDDVDLFGDWGIARPYDRIPDGQVALSAWGRVHTMTGVSSGEIELFFEAYAGELGPERFTC